MNTTDIKTGIDFENYVMQLFLLDGIRTLSTPASNDYGSDLIIKYNGIIFSAQCKFYSKPVSLKAVQEVMGSLKYYNANYGIVITNSSFTQQAQNLARTNNVLLIDGKESLESPKEILDAFIKRIDSNRPIPTPISDELTMDDLVVRYGVSKGTILKNFLGAGLPYDKVGREYRFSEQDITAWEIEKRSIPYRKDESILLPGYVAYIKQKNEELKAAKQNGDKKMVQSIKQDLKNHGQFYVEPWMWVLTGIGIAIAFIAFCLIIIPTIRL